MRKVSLVIILVLCSICLASCGSNDVPANNTIVDTPTPTSEPESTDPTIAPDDEGVVDSGVWDGIPTSEPSEEGNEGSLNLGEYEKMGVRLDYSMLFPTGVNAEAWLQEHRFENPDYSFYITHFKGAKGTMDFTWVAPAGIGNLYWLSENEKTFHVANDNRRLAMWYGGKITDESTTLKSYTPDVIMGSVSGTPVADTYQVVEDSDNAYRVIFKVESQMFDAAYIGIACFVDFYDIGECYQFTYYMLDFNETEALAVVNSIERVNLDDLGIIVQE